MFNETSNQNFKPRRKYWIFIPIFFILAGLALGWIVQFLWNAILPEIVGVKALNYQQALGLLVLCRILFGGFRGARPGGKRPPFGGPGNRRNNWMNMSEEERAKIRASWEDRCRKRES